MTVFGLGSNFKLSKNVWEKLIPSDFNRQHCGLSRERWGEMAWLGAVTTMRVGDRGSKVSCSYGKRGWMSDLCSQANTLSPHKSSYLMVLWRLPREGRRCTQGSQSSQEENIRPSTAWYHLGTKCNGLQSWLLGICLEIRAPLYSKGFRMYFWGTLRRRRILHECFTLFHKLLPW